LGQDLHGFDGYSGGVLDGKVGDEGFFEGVVVGKVIYDRVLLFSV